MRQLLPVFFALLILPAGGQGLSGCAGDPAVGKDLPSTGKPELRGYSVFPVQAPERLKKQKNERNETSDDAAFTESLRMFLGLSGPKPPDCFIQPRERGLLRDE